MLGSFGNEQYKFTKETLSWIEERKRISAIQAEGRPSGGIVAPLLNQKPRKREFPINLMEVLQTPEYLKTFEAYLEDNELPRVTSFLCDVLEFKKIRHDQTKKASAQEINRRYISNQSNPAVKFPASIASLVLRKLEKGDLSNNLFDIAFEMVFNLCEMKDFRRFAQHSSYQEMVPDYLQQRLYEDESLKQNGWINDSGYQSLHVDVISGADIYAKDSTSRPDTFCIISVGSRAYKTDIEKNTHTPSWESHFEFPITSTSLFCRVSVWNKDKSANYGQVTVYLCDIESPWLPDWHALTADEEINEDEEVQGDLLLRFRFSTEPPQEEHVAVPVVESSSYSVGDIIRTKVSKKKKRFEVDGFNLDLSYITEHLIAMGFPSESIEGIYRNNMRDVQRFFRSRHPDHYWVYNLCSEKSYAVEKFDERVTRFGFDDHNPCPWNMLLPLCEHLKRFLSQHPQNVACIHCKAGKGRTGLVISAYLLFSGQMKTAEDALDFFGKQRTTNNKGVTIPSQKRYVKYMEMHLKSISDPSIPAIPARAYYLLKKITIYNPPGGIKPSNVVMKVLTNSYLFNSSKVSVAHVTGKDGNEDYVEFDFKSAAAVPLNEDIKINVGYSSLFKHEKLFHFWFNTRFISNNKLVLEKRELDKAVKDTKHQIFKENLRVKLDFEPIDEKKIQDININTDFEIMSNIITQSKSLAKAYSFKGKDGKIKDGDEEKEHSRTSGKGTSTSNVNSSPQKDQSKRSVFLK
jgi:phosphatidylinositol-3,4,5-trisphosphate 3-phosphatase/dual-specificity protein phosphatase PTEN